MSFYKLEKASIEEAKNIINKLDEEEKKDYLLKAADAPYISSEIFSLLVQCQKSNHVVLAQAFSEIALQMSKDNELNPKLQTLIDTGEDFCQVASQSLINGAYKMNALTVAALIEQGADASYSNNSALRSALAENNTPVVNELLKHSNNSEAYEHLVNNDGFHFGQKDTHQTTIV